MWRWIVLVVLAVMAALLIYAACCVDGDIDRQSEAHPPKPEKRTRRWQSMRCLSLHPGNVALHSCRALLSMKRALSVLLYGLRRWLELATRNMKNSMW